MLRQLPVGMDGAGSGDDDDDSAVVDKLGVECIQTLEGHRGQVLCLISLSDSTIASGGCYVDKTIRVWDVLLGTQLSRLSGFTASCVSLLGLDDTTLCSGHEDGNIFIWDIAENKLRHQLAGHWRHRAPVLSLCVLVMVLVVPWYPP